MRTAERDERYRPEVPMAPAGCTHTDSGLLARYRERAHPTERYLHARRSGLRMPVDTKKPEICRLYGASHQVVRHRVRGVL